MALGQVVFQSVWFFSVFILSPIVHYSFIHLSLAIDNTLQTSNVYWTVRHCNSWRFKDQFDVTCYLVHFLCAQHVSDINISIIRSLRLCCSITTSVVLFSVRCVLEILCGWFWVVLVLQAEPSACKMNTTQNQLHQISNTQRTENKTTDMVIQQHSRKLLMMDILMSETCWAHKKWNKIASDIKLVFHSSTLQAVFYSSKSLVFPRNCFGRRVRTAAVNSIWVNLTVFCVSILFWAL